MILARTRLAALLAVLSFGPTVAWAQGPSPEAGGEGADAGEQATGAKADQSPEATVQSAQPNPAAVDGLVDETWEEPRVPIDPVWNVLLLPERLIETMFFPVAGLVSTVETYRLDERVVDLLVG